MSRSSKSNKSSKTRNASRGAHSNDRHTDMRVENIPRSVMVVAVVSISGLISFTILAGIYSMAFG